MIKWNRIHSDDDYPDVGFDENGYKKEYLVATTSGKVITGVTTGRGKTSFLSAQEYLRLKAVAWAELPDYPDFKKIDSEPGGKDYVMGGGFGPCGDD